ncbi:unnamed protein product [Closterium sp. NIES-65]|nr:unnamed protein product [Closterium sp. NIES-65]
MAVAAAGLDWLSVLTTNATGRRSCVFVRRLKSCPRQDALKVLPCAPLQEEALKIRRDSFETAWAVSNVTAGDSWHKAAVIGGDAMGGGAGMGGAGKASRMYELLVHLLRTAPLDIKREVAFALANLCVDPAEQEPIGERRMAVQQSRVAALVDAGCLLPFLSLIRSADADAVRLGLQFTEVVRRGVGRCAVVRNVPAAAGVAVACAAEAGAAVAEVAVEVRCMEEGKVCGGNMDIKVLRVLPDKRGPRLVEEADGIDAIEAAQFVGNEELHSMSSYLVDTYFGEDYGLEEGG